MTLQVSTAESALSLEQQRALFIEADAYTSDTDSQVYKDYMQQLVDYPLQPYLELKALSQSLTISKRQQIEAFLTKYESSPLDRPLRKKWLEYLIDHNQNELFMATYRDLGNVKLTCKYGELLLKDETSKAQALRMAEELWVVGKSQPKACDPLFKEWQNLGKRTPELVWKRLRLTAKGGDTTLVPYLKSLLPQEQRYLADLWLKVRRAPSYVSRSSRFPHKTPALETEILTYGLTRLIWQDRNLALRSWDELSKRFAFSDNQQQQIFHKFAVALALSNHDQADLWLEKSIDFGVDSELARWHLAHVIRKQDWQHALDVVDYAIGQGGIDNVFEYWQAKAYKELGADELSQQGFQHLAKQRHYYGFLASAELSVAPSLNDKPIHAPQADIDSLMLLPPAQRAFEFRALEHYTSARREWNFLQSNLSEQQKIAAAVLADQQGWHAQAIFGFARLGYLDDLGKRFPMPFDNEVQFNAEKNDIDVAWAYAIARRESSFMADAASGVGALGLMQLMPGTARFLAKKKVKRQVLFDPQQNVELGTQYMRYLLDKMDNNPVLATASYNAGWRKVKQWQPETGTMPLDIWIETIPYKETRNYVKAVLAYQQIYRQHLGNQSNVFQDLLQMQITPKS
ncbi:transglycosylase SLT domain-containing protein [Paraglaciecola sp. 2405UD69-4]|uniref:transglycosylase SLT domain-containing protein n=1 Tax=Paraglaciecola sp. 2405UD69-4 TaxID=3391836 RepID=UPI0039C9F0A9